MDCRYLISNMKPDCKILSLTTVATPHRGSPFADYCMEKIGKHSTQIKPTCNEYEADSFT